MLDSLDRGRRDPGERPSPVDPPGAASRIGILPILDGAELRAAWAGDRLLPDLREVILITDLLCREHGGRLRLTKLLGDGIYSTGSAAEVLPLNLPPDKPARPGPGPSAHVDWLVRRLNRLYVFGDGGIETAQFVPALARIRLRVPLRGYTRDSRSLSEWFEFGCTPGEVKNPHRLFS